MAETEYPQDAAPKKKSKRPMIIGLVLAILLGGGGFFATFSGMILGPHEQMKKDANKAAQSSAFSYPGPKIKAIEIPINAASEVIASLR